MALQEIADIMEKPEAEIKEMYEAVIKSAPDYNIDSIVKELH